MMTVDEVLKMVSDGEQIPANVALDNFFQVAYECLNLRDEINGLTGSLDRAEKALKEAQEHEQEPVAFWWIGPDGKDNGGPYRGKPSDAAIDNALNMGCEPVLLYARPVPANLVESHQIKRDSNSLEFEGIKTAPAVAAGLPAIGPYRDFIPAPAVPAPSVPEEWREVMTELADDLAIEIDQSYPPERRAYPSEQRRYEREMEIVNRARALLQSSQAAPVVPNLVESHQIKAPDCRTCANRGQVNGLSQESYCESCVYQGRGWRQNHFVDASKMVDAVKRRCEACAILPCSCK